MLMFVEERLGGYTLKMKKKKKADSGKDCHVFFYTRLRYGNSSPENRDLRIKNINCGKELNEK